MSAKSPSPLPEITLGQLQSKSITYRRMILAMIYTAKGGHTGGDLSCIDIPVPVGQST